VILVARLPRGWTLWADPVCHEVAVLPWFRKGERKLSAVEMAHQPEAPVVFHEVKRLSDIAERQRVGADDMGHRGLDMARFALQLSLGLVEKWDKSMLETEVV
jgi:hypothetical protein